MPPKHPLHQGPIPKAMAIEVLATVVSPEVRLAAIQAISSERPVEISETLRDRREETLALVQKLLASAGIEATFFTPKVKQSLPATEAVSTKEISPEQAWLGELKTRFDALSRLHPGVQWTDVEKALKASPEAMQTLMKLDEAGFEMNVFQSKEQDFIQFRTAQLSITEIDAKFRTITYDKQAQTNYSQFHANGNAVDLAAALGCELADLELYEQFRVEDGWVWLKTDATTRKTGLAFIGLHIGIGSGSPYLPFDYGSFCAALRVKKVL